MSEPELLPCIKCGCPDELVLDSSRYARASWIDCHWCDYRMQAECCEEELRKRWNNLDRSSMPVFDLDAELAKIEAASSLVEGHRD